MSVTVRPYRRDGWEVEIRVLLPDGTRVRERRKSPVSTKSGSKRWGERRERSLIEERSKPEPEPSEPREEVPTLAEFAQRFLENHAQANRQKPSTVASKETILRVHLIPILGSKRLDRISNEDVQRIKNRLQGKARKTVNNVLTVLNTMMKVAVEWNVIGEVPCSIKLLPVSPRDADFHDFHEYERLVDASKTTDAQAHLIVLLGGEAGLRCGEMMALEWTDVDFTRQQLQVQRSEWKGKVTVPKGGRSRRVPMTNRLAGALRDHRHLRGTRVLPPSLMRVRNDQLRRTTFASGEGWRMTEDDGRPLTQKIVQVLVRKAARKANVRNGGVRGTRHAKCLLANARPDPDFRYLSNSVANRWS